MTVTQQWRYLNLTRNSFYILFPEKGIMSSRQSFLAVSTFVSKELVQSLAENFWIPLNNRNNVNFNYLKIPKTHCGPHKMPSRATCGPSLWAPDLDLLKSSRKKCPSLPSIVSGGLQSNKYSIHFSSFITEFYLCNMLRKCSTSAKNW